MAKARTLNKVNYKKAVTIHYGDRDNDKTRYIGKVTYYNVRTVAQAIRRFFCEYRDEKTNFVPMYVRESKVS